MTSARNYNYRLSSLRVTLRSSNVIHKRLAVNRLLSNNRGIVEVYRADDGKTPGEYGRDYAKARGAAIKIE